MLRGIARVGKCLGKFSKCAWEREYPGGEIVRKMSGGIFPAECPDLTQDYKSLRAAV